MRLSLLRRRLQGLFGRSFRLEVGSEIGRGTTVRMRIPLRRRFDMAEESPEAGSSDPGVWPGLGGREVDPVKHERRVAT